MQQHVYSTNWIGKKWADPKPDQKTPARLSATQMIAPGKVFALRAHCVCTACALRGHCVRTACTLQ